LTLSLSRNERHHDEAHEKVSLTVIDRRLADLRTSRW
jgi:hypothetical protein